MRKDGHNIKLKMHGKAFFAGVIVIVLGCFFYHYTQNAPFFKDHTSIKPPLETVRLGCGQSALMAVAQAKNTQAATRLGLLFTEDQYTNNPITSFYDLSNWAKASGMEATGLKISSTDITELPLPAIIHTKADHFLALMIADKERVVVIDRAVFQYEISRHTFNELFSGYVMCFQ